MSKNFWIQRSQDLALRVILEVRDWMDYNLFTPVQNLETHLEQKFPGHVVTVSLGGGEVEVKVGDVVVTISLI